MVVTVKIMNTQVFHVGLPWDLFGNALECKVKKLKQRRDHHFSEEFRGHLNVRGK